MPQTQVYPRWRGEHITPFCDCPVFAGLSPLARGTRVSANPEEIEPRFIPAGAGNTHMIRRARRWHSVYPRWRGEHRITPRFLPRQRGLSPLARGTLHEPKFQGWDSRFIPAGAGNTYILKRLLNHKTVYPRWRGEHLKRRASASRLLGLSPLARGTLTSSWEKMVFARFIPAGAGNTALGPGVVLAHAVYPRWRGEHGAVGGFGTCCIGLSPLARGTRFAPRLRDRRSRFIPAGAGNTVCAPAP